MTTALLDACVLYPPSLRDLLMWLATTRTYAPRFTEQIRAEWIRNVLADNPEITPAQLERTRQLMNAVAPNCLVSGYESHIPSLSLRDANDIHVLAAAIHAKSQLIVTFNLSDFPATILRTHNVQAVHPDDFLSGLFEERTPRFVRGVQIHRASLRNPPKTATDYLQTLRATRLTGLALRIEAYSAVI